MSGITKSANPDILSWIKLKSRKLFELIEPLSWTIADRIGIVAEEDRLKAELKKHLKAAYFKANSDATKSEQVIHTFDADKLLQINFVNAYIIQNQQHLTQLIALLGPTHPLTSEVQFSKKLAVDVSDMSDGQVAQLERDIAKLSKQKVETHTNARVTENFHSLRHVYLTVEDNLRLDQVLPVQIQITNIDEARKE